MSTMSNFLVWLTSAPSNYQIWWFFWFFLGLNSKSQQNVPLYTLSDLLKWIFWLTGDNFHPRSKPKLWPENSVFELLGPLVPPKSALGGPILLAHENSGHKQPRITRVRFLGQKSSLEHFENAQFWPKSRFWSRFSLLDPYFWLKTPPNGPI